MLIEIFTVGSLSTNCYVVSSQQTKDAIIIDPGLDFASEARAIFDYVTQVGLNVKLIVNTHGHVDHINGDAIFQEKYNVPICIHRFDSASLRFLENMNFPPAVMLDDGSVVGLGNESLKVMHTPGHTPGSIILIGQRVVFTGDTLFAGGIGRTDFPGGSDIEMRASLTKLVELPEYFLVYPGHGPMSTIGEEKRVNPFLSAR